MGTDQMITDEELNAIVDNYCRQIRKICNEAIYAKNDEILDKVSEIIKLANRAQEIKSMREVQKMAGEKNGTAQ